MTFQSSAFQNSGFQVDDEVPPEEPGTGPQPTGGSVDGHQGTPWYLRPMTRDVRDVPAVRVMLIPQDDGRKAFASMLVEIDRMIEKRNKAIAALLLASA